MLFTAAIAPTAAMAAIATQPRIRVREFSALNYANGMTTWSLSTSEHTIEDVLHAGYFEAVRDMFGPGDWIFVSASDGPLILWARGNALGCTVERVR
jgi:hypothetical protein